jgi:hypothetical protein
VKAVPNEKLESLLETDRSKDLMNELDFPISAKEVTDATKKLKRMYFSSLAFKILLNSFD